MDPGLSELADIFPADVVVSIAGRDAGQMLYVIAAEDGFVLLADGKGRTLEKPKRKKRKHIQKVLRSETRVAAKLRSGDKVLNSELRRDLAYLRREMQSNDLGGF
ncbi:MAG TPA: KOW domain-containing RNA-binding protein [Candidatus Faecousia intestinigallinarum]|nr:KOW domain-containing RNA-binding protein [Candidatus Faecousia intestinigallinarum]